MPEPGRDRAIGPQQHTGDHDADDEEQRQQCAAPSRCPLPAAPGRLVAPSRRRTVSRRPGGRRRRARKPGSVHSDAYRGACAARPPPGRAIIHLAHAAAPDGAGAALEQPTRGPEDGIPAGTALMWRATRPAAWLCSGRGLPYLRRRRRSGGLLPHRFTLAGRAVPCGTVARRSVLCGTVCRPRLGGRPGITRHPALRSPDFPPRPHRTRRWPARLLSSSR